MIIFNFNFFHFLMRPKEKAFKIESWLSCGKYRIDMKTEYHLEIYFQLNMPRFKFKYIHLLCVCVSVYQREVYKNLYDGLLGCELASLQSTTTVSILMWLMHTVSICLYLHTYIQSIWNIYFSVYQQLLSFSPFLRCINCKIEISHINNNWYCRLVCLPATSIILEWFSMSRCRLESE